MIKDLILLYDRPLIKVDQIIKYKYILKSNWLASGVPIYPSLHQYGLLEILRTLCVVDSKITARITFPLDEAGDADSSVVTK